MKAVVSVVGNDMVGILAKVSNAIAAENANVIDMTQSVLDGCFCMMMIIDIEKMTCSIDELRIKISEAVPEMVVHVMHTDIFTSMHRI